MSPAPPRLRVEARAQSLGRGIATSDDALETSTSAIETAPLITEAPNLELQQKDGSPYVVITVTNGAGIHITTVLLGDSYPTTFSAVGGSSGVSHPGISTGSIVGIAVGLTLGFLVFFAAMYIYFLRLRQARSLRRKKRRRRSNGGGSRKGKIPAGGGGGGGPPPPPPSGFAPANP